jgi:WxcM-like protein
VKRSMVPPVTWTAGAASHSAPTIRSPMGESVPRDAVGVRAATEGTAAWLHARFANDVALFTVERADEPRGVLTPFDFDRLPFVVQRVFTVTDVPAGTVRGAHRHRRGVQALFCLAGRIDVELRRDDERAEISLFPDGTGLVITAGVWSQQRYSLDGSALLVLASEPYDPTSYD